MAAIGTMMLRTPGSQTVTTLLTRTRIATTITAAVAPGLLPAQDEEDKGAVQNNYL